MEYSENAESKIGDSAIKQIKHDIDSGHPELNFRWEVFSERLLDHFRSANVFVDCGAEWGFYIYLALKFGNPGIIIHAFEPDPVRHSALKKEFSRYPNVYLYQNALGDSKKCITLYKPKKPGASATLDSHNSQLGASIETEPFIAEQVILDDILNPESVEIVKMDIEGGEIFALYGMQKILSYRKAHIYAELHPRYVESIKPGGMKDIHDLMVRYGYRFMDSNDHLLTVDSGRGIFRPPGSNQSMP